MVHLQNLPGRDVEAQHGVLGENRLLSNERLAQAVLPRLPSASHDQVLNQTFRVFADSTSERYGDRTGIICSRQERVSRGKKHDHHGRDKERNNRGELEPRQVTEPLMK